MKSQAVWLVSVWLDIVTKSPLIKNLTMGALRYKMGLRLARIPFVRSAMDDRADLSAFDHKLTFKLVLGLFLITISNTLCWPAITALAGLSVYYRKPWIALIGGPLVYGITFVGSAVGMALSGAKYARAFSRWLTRVMVERMLSHGDAEN